MSRRRDPHKAKLRRDRIRHEKHAQKVPPPPEPPVIRRRFAAERRMREIQTLIAGHKFRSADEMNARIQEIHSDSRLSEKVQMRKRGDPKWRAQELAYDAQEIDSTEEALRLARQSLAIDPQNVDANRLMVSLGTRELPDKIHLMRGVVREAEAVLGERLYEKSADVWGDLEIYPYLRAVQELSQYLVEYGELTEAIAHYERMLELTPRDPQGIRDPLLVLYLQTGRTDDAGRLIDSFREGDVMATAVWGRVLQRWIEGDLPAAQAALEKARQVNRFAEPFLTRTVNIRDLGPEYYRLGDEFIGEFAAEDLRPACDRHPGFREWLLRNGLPPQNT